MATANSAALLVLICACSDGAAPRDAAPDVDNGACGGLLRFTGEYVDWNSGATFCGIYKATFQARGSTAADTTEPNGRFDMCIPDQATVVVDITPPAEPSHCYLPENETYQLPGLAVANKEVISAGGFWSGRTFVTGQPPVVPDPAKAQVFVHVNGSPRLLTLEAPHGSAQALVNGTWAPGSTGSDVYFPNVTPGLGTTILSAEGNAIGTGSIPLEAGKMTTLSIILN